MCGLLTGVSGAISTGAFPQVTGFDFLSGSRSSTCGVSFYSAVIARLLPFATGFRAGAGGRNFPV
jgi:hypothetical protein